MPYSELLEGHMDGLSWGAANDPADFSEVTGAGLRSAVAGTSFFRDIINEPRLSARNSDLRDAGFDAFNEAGKIVKQEAGLFGDSAKAHAKKLQEEAHRLSDEFIMDKRLNDSASPAAQLRTTSEIRELTVAARQEANSQFASAMARADGPMARYGGALVGSALGTMTDPINALTLPFGASASTGVLRAMLIDGAINMGVEALQTPENMAWAKEAGVQYGFGEAVTNIATAGVGAAAISGGLRGAGKLLTRGKSLEVLDKVAADRAMPSEARDAAQYQATVAQIDDGSPIRNFATDEQVAINRQNLDEMQASVIENREPVFDESIFERQASVLESEISDIQQRLDAPEQAPTVSDIPAAVLPRELAGAKPRYGYGEKQFTLKFENDVERAAYITAQKTPSKRDAEFRSFLKEQGLDDAQIRDLGLKVREKIKGMAKDSEPGELVVGGIKPDSFAQKADRMKMQAELTAKRAELDGVKRQQSAAKVKAEEAAPLIDDIAPERVANPAQHIEERAAEITQPGVNDAMLADFYRLAEEFPQLRVEGVDGNLRSMKELTDEFADDELTMQALTFCGVGK